MKLSGIGILRLYEGHCLLGVKPSAILEPRKVGLLPLPYCFFLTFTPSLDHKKRDLLTTVPSAETPDQDLLFGSNLIDLNLVLMETGLPGRSQIQSSSSMTSILSCQGLHTAKRLGGLNHFNLSTTMQAPAGKSVLERLLISWAPS